MTSSKQNNSTLIKSSEKTSFADVAHQTLMFDNSIQSDKLILELIDTRWMQRLRFVRQTGNTNLVYMYSEHSRFGHSLGVAYLASLLMHQLQKLHGAQVDEYQNAVAAAALLHDIGHVAPGSHLAERVWGKGSPGKHEQLSLRIIEQDEEIRSILNKYDSNLCSQVLKILSNKDDMPSWTKAIISGGGWNADRGNWAIVDSAMCSVTYGRYNISALIDAFRLTDDGELVLQENRLDALTHFFLARDSMYRQVYQHRVLQTADRLTELIVMRLRDLILNEDVADHNATNSSALLKSLDIFCDNTMWAALTSPRYSENLTLETAFCMTEPWWAYHLAQWCTCKDPILKDLSTRLRDRRLFKTIRLLNERDTNHGINESAQQQNTKLIERAKIIASKYGFDPKYYVTVIDSRDKHRAKIEEPPRVILDNGELVRALEAEPLIHTLFIHPLLEHSGNDRTWLAVPREIKKDLGKLR